MPPDSKSENNNFYVHLRWDKSWFWCNGSPHVLIEIVEQHDLLSKMNINIKHRYYCQLLYLLYCCTLFFDWLNRLVLLKQHRNVSMCYTNTLLRKNFIDCNSFCWCLSYVFKIGFCCLFLFHYFPFSYCLKTLKAACFCRKKTF